LAVEYSTWLDAIVRIFVSSRRPCDSDAFATWSYDTNFAHPLSDATFVSADVSVVLPWSMWPMVPTLTCGFERSNFSFAIAMRLRYFVPWMRATTSSLTFCGACSYRSQCIEYVARPCVRDRRSVA